MHQCETEPADVRTKEFCVWFKIYISQYSQNICHNILDITIKNDFYVVVFIYTFSI
jgi:hypothetical protein